VRWITACAGCNGLHRPVPGAPSRPATDIDETLGALSDLVHAGKVRAIGSSTFPAEQIVEAQWVAERRGHVRFRCEQPPYSILTRGVEGAVLPTCSRYGMGVIAWSPLGSGWLTGRYRKGQNVDMTTGRPARLPQRYDPSLPGNADKLEVVESLMQVAGDVGCSLAHLALAFVVAHPDVTAAIIGPRTMDQFTDLLGGSTVALDDAVLDRIDTLVPPGSNLNTADSGWVPPALAEPSLRRRSPTDRSAA